MEENMAFQFTEQTTSNVSLEFKKEKAAYIAQRNARKKEAQDMIKNDRNFSSSSDDDPLPVKQEPARVQFQAQKEDTKTVSSKSSSGEHQRERFKDEREMYKAQRVARRHEAAKNIEKEFGASSSSDDCDIPVSNPKINVIENSIREPPSLLQSPSHEEFQINGLLTVDYGRSQKEKSPNKMNMSASVRLKKAVGEKKPQKERYEVEVPSRKGVNIWLEQVLEFKENSVELGERSIPIYEVTKTKLLFNRTPNGNYKLKLTFREEDVFYAVDHKKLNDLCLDHYYYLFAKVVSLKLQLMGKRPSLESKPKLGLSEGQLKGAQITGKVRRSSFFGGWEGCAGVVNNSGLCIYKEGKEKPMLVIGYNSIRELWTRFDLDSDNLVIKFLHNSSKVQLSIPFENYLSRDNWLYHIYNLASK